ncbi:hypothetical protein [Persephonella sp.]
MIFENELLYVKQLDGKIEISLKVNIGSLEAVSVAFNVAKEFNSPSGEKVFLIGCSDNKFLFLTAGKSFLALSTTNKQLENPKHLVLAGENGIDSKAVEFLFINAENIKDIIGYIEKNQGKEE